MFKIAQRGGVRGARRGSKWARLGWVQQGGQSWVSQPGHLHYVFFRINPSKKSQKCWEIFL